nr:hypothetical protein [Streptomyces sp. RLB1-33]
MAVEQGQKPLSLLVTAGQRHDSPQFQAVLDAIRVPRIGPGPTALAGQGPRRPSLRLPREPRLPAQTRRAVHHPGEGRPHSQPPEARVARWPPTEVRQGRLRAPARRRVRD